MADGRSGRATGHLRLDSEHQDGHPRQFQCVMNYDSATGWMIGEANKGLHGRFVMIEPMRGLALPLTGPRASRKSLIRMPRHCRDRLQGRAHCRARRRRTSGPDRSSCIPSAPHAVPIRAFNEAHAQVLYLAQERLEARSSDQKRDSSGAANHMGLMTPVLKGIFTETVCQCRFRPRRMYGGHGLISPGKAWKQFRARRRRIALIYEGPTVFRQPIGSGANAARRRPPAT